MKKKNNIKFRKVRRGLDLTQEQVGNMIGRSRQWVSAIERGQIEINYDDAVLLAKAYGGTPDIFLPEEIS